MKIHVDSVGRPDLRVLLAFWVRELNIPHWKIDIRYVKNLCAPAEGAATGGAGNPVLGLCSPLPDNRTAVIEIRDPVLSDDGVPYPASEVPRTVVHELYHVKVSETGLGLMTGVGAAVQQEQLVWDTSDALVRLWGSEEGRLLASAAHAHLGRFGRASARAAVRLEMAQRPRQAARARRQGIMDPLMLLIAALRGVLSGSDPAAAVEAAKGILDEAAKASGGDGGGESGDVPPGPSDDVMPARAAGDCDKPNMARAQRRAMPGPSIKTVTEIDVRKILAEENEKGEMIRAARASRVGVTPQLAMHLQGLPLAEARKVIDGLELKPTDTPQVRAAAVPVGSQGGSEKPAPTGDEAETIRKMNNAFGRRGEPTAASPGVWDTSRLKAARAAVKPAAQSAK